jgi:hypothetical protein
VTDLLVYIASSFENRERVKAFAAQLPPGWAWSYDWTGHTFDDDPRRVADEDCAGIAQADAVVALLPGGPGTHWEIGYARGLGIPTCIVGDPPRKDPRWPRCPFYLLASHRVDTEQGALEWLKECSDA